MQVNCLPGTAAFDLLRNEWDELAGRSMTATPFQAFAYQRSWWTNLGVGECLTLTARDGDGTLQGIGCFYLQDGILHFNGGTEESDYLDLITPAAQTSAVWVAFMRLMAGSDFP